ncbi:uncharacterized protein LOC144000986 [Festucalex cinctus]
MAATRDLLSGEPAAEEDERCQDESGSERQADFNLCEEMKSHCSKVETMDCVTAASTARVLQQSKRESQEEDEDDDDDEEEMERLRARRRTFQSGEEDVGADISAADELTTLSDSSQYSSGSILEQLDSLSRLLIPENAGRAPAELPRKTSSSGQENTNM